MSQGNGIAERLGVEPYRPRMVEQNQEVSKTLSPEVQQEVRKKTNNLNFIAAMNGTFSAIAMLLSVRLLLISSIAGAFSLGQSAMLVQSSYSLITLTIFCAFTVPFLTYLDIQTRKGR